MTENLALIVACGRGTRFSAPDSADQTPKQYRKIDHLTVLGWTMMAFLDHPRIDAVQVVINPEDTELYNATISSFRSDKLHTPVFGGATRQASVLAGLEAYGQDMDDACVLIHDAARPALDASVISRVLEGLSSYDAVTAALPVSDTMRQRADDETLGDAVDRERLWSIQTPQAFRLGSLREAHRAALADGRRAFTDDTLLYQWAGGSVRPVPGATSNLKITRQEDLAMAAHYLSPSLEPRVGTGYDVHAFEPGYAVILGGISIPHDKKLKGHSDADVGLHALTDAILGALGDGDIGKHFPPSDPQWKGAASDQFLMDAVERVAVRQGRITHLDLTLICEEPKIGPHREAMRGAIAGICNLPVHRISVKATTSEGLGFTGRREGIAALATATLLMPGEPA